MLILYGDPNTGNTRKVSWALEELAAPYELRLVSLRAGDHEKPAFRALNPTARVPVIDDDGFVLWESDAILWYVGETRRGLIPETTADRARVQQWMSWSANHLSDHMFRPRRMRMLALRLGTPFDQARYAELVATAPATLEVLDRHLADRRFVVGDALTMADIALAIQIEFGRGEGVSLQACPHVASWFERLTSRPAWKRLERAGE